MKKRILLSLILSILTSFFLTSCYYEHEPKSDDPATKNVSPSPTIVLRNGIEYDVDSIKIVNLKDFKSKNLYVKHCKFCHGGYGKGDGVKARIDTTLCPYDLSKESKSDQQIYYIILNGQNRMPGQKELKEDEIWLLILYIKEKF